MSRKRDQFYWRGPAGDGWSRREDVVRPVNSSPDAENCESADDRIEESIYERFAQDLDLSSISIQSSAASGATIRAIFSAKPRIVLSNEHISLEVGWSPALKAAEAAQTNDLARRLPRLVGNV